VICWLVRRWLDVYHDGELTPWRRARVERHLTRCTGCAGEVQALRRLREVLTTASVAEPPEAVWAAFWPQVRTRLIGPSPDPEPVWQRAWGAMTSHPRLVLAPAVAAASLAVLAVMAPWHQTPSRAPGPAPASMSAPPATLDQVVIQSIETADPDLPVMVYANPESDMTVLWVFGLERTGT
jgi:anti-sigma factor RsiW